MLLREAEGDSQPKKWPQTPCSCASAMKYSCIHNANKQSNKQTSKQTNKPLKIIRTITLRGIKLNMIEHDQSKNEHTSIYIYILIICNNCNNQLTTHNIKKKNIMFMPVSALQIYIYKRTYLYVNACICIHICMNMYVYIYIYIYMCVCISHCAYDNPITYNVNVYMIMYACPCTAWSSGLCCKLVAF